MPWTFFKLSEFACLCGCKANLIQHDFVDKLEHLREALGFPLVVRSGYRCPAHNARVSTTGATGPHTTGRAVDVAVFGRQAFLLIEQAMLDGEFTGVGISQRGDQARRFIHLDDLSEERFRPTVWSY